LITNEIAVGVYQYVAGNAGLMALMVIAIIVIMLFAIRAGKIVVLMLLIPVISTFIVSTTFIEIPKYASILLWLIVGFIFGGALIAFAFRT